MKRKIEFPEELCADEAVCFIADRHNVTPRRLLRDFLVGETSLSLEPNEVEILNGLYGTGKDDEVSNYSYFGLAFRKKR